MCGNSSRENRESLLASALTGGDDTAGWNGQKTSQTVLLT
jgi:hypothetical protein